VAKQRALHQKESKYREWAEWVTFREKKDKMIYIQEICDTKAIISQFKRIDKSKYTVDLEAKMATLREEMFKQMGFIDQVNQMKELEQQKRVDLFKLLKRMQTKEGWPKKLPVIRTIGATPEGKKRKKPTPLKNPFSGSCESHLSQDSPLPRASSLKRKSVIKKNSDSVNLVFSLGGNTFTRIWTFKKHRKDFLKLNKSLKFNSTITSSNELETESMSSEDGRVKF
jgi:hypothetical protein